MHRTTTTAALLVTVAVSALSGCTTVRTPAPGPSAAPSPPPAAEPSGRAAPQVVQAPAREALDRVGPSPRRTTSAAEQHSPTAPATASAPTAPTAAPRTGPRPERQRPQHPHHPQHREPRTAKPPRTNVPAVPDLGKHIPQGPAHVCALGRTYGGWQPGSPESTICDNTYGR
ncbi:hypothetical protein [Streptomyces sp. JB150]|uniref:hypothetical protein n=1 Tax=Streptomyces sp. JB150 TaxID=2714844 RepID=UPI001F0E8076|nr:hypothetical protein [Streptomyces sp. JB150]